MPEIYSDIDSLTGIHNEVYLKAKYQEYTTKYPNASLIMFDFKGFKHFNDTFGHDVGDLYLQLFAGIIDESFVDSIVVRLHGDEYCILTKYSIEEINKIFDVCDAKIKLSYEANLIPEIFSYNAGIVKAEHGIANTTLKADYMMYHAKKNNKRAQAFNSEVWNEKILEDEFIESINEAASKSEFIYNTQRLYTRDKENTGIDCLYTKGKDCNSLFSPDKYDFIRNNAQMRKIDLFNLQHLLLRLDVRENKYILNFDYKSLLTKPDLIEYLGLLVHVMKLKAENVIISINVNALDSKHFIDIIELIEKMKGLGFNICLGRYSSKTGDSVYENSPIDYIKFDQAYWKTALSNPRTDHSLKAKVEMFTSYVNPVVPIFTCIENENEYSYATNITKRPILLCGNYFEKEKKLTLKKTK